MQQWYYFYLTSPKSKSEIYTELSQEKFQNSKSILLFLFFFLFYTLKSVPKSLVFKILKFILKEKKYLLH